MDLKNIRTRQESAFETNPKSNEYVIGMDIGYSSVKVFYENGHFVFPSYAKKLDTTMLNISDTKDIIYMEEGSNEQYIIGYNAQTMIDNDNTNDSDNELFSRNRYRDKRFKIICNTALAMATLSKKDNKDICIQTGLPSSYVEGDSNILRKVLSVPASFKLKIGSADWRSFKISVKADKIHIMPQPSGSLYSSVIKPDGKYTDNAKAMLSSNVLVLDAGFGTFDFYGLLNRSVKCKESTDELGMRQVLNKIVKKIQKDTGENISITALQKYLAKGKFVSVNEEEMKSEEISLSPYFKASNEEIFTAAMEKIKSVTNTFRGYNYVIVTGGTGEAWFEDIKKWLSGMQTITVVPANINDRLSLIYSNARGYYFYRYMLNSKGKGR